jgi:hypothetical protein
LGVTRLPDFFIFHPQGASSGTGLGGSEKISCKILKYNNFHYLCRPKIGDSSLHFAAVHPALRG